MTVNYWLGPGCSWDSCPPKLRWDTKDAYVCKPAAEGCNVCAECCEDFISKGKDCYDCVKEQCWTPLFPYAPLK